MITKDSTTSRSKLSQPAPVFLTVGEEYRLASPLEDYQLPDRPTVQEVAKWLRKSPNTIYLWYRQGLIPHKVVGRSKIFDKAHRGGARGETWPQAESNAVTVRKYKALIRHTH